MLVALSLCLVCVQDVQAQVKQVSPLLEESRQVALELHQLPLGDERTSALLTHGLELLQQAQKMVEAHLDELGAAQGPLSKQDRTLTRIQQARIAYVTGELYRLTAIKRTAEDPTRQAYLDSAVLIFSDMRKNFASIADAELARVGLARCYRLLGQLDQANDSIKPLLRQPDDTTNASEMNLWRAAIVEELEILLINQPDQAMAQAAKWLMDQSFVSQADWKRSLGRIEALAAMQLALANPQDTAVLLAVTRLRDSDLPQSVQLQYMVQLELASGIPIVTADQRNDWVLLLVDSLSPQQAVQRISAQVPDITLLNARAVMAYGSALWQDGKLPLAVNCFDRAMRLLDDVDPLKNTAALWYAQCLYQQVIQDGTPATRKRARAALARIVQTHPAKTVRLESLKQWVNLEQIDDGLDAAAAVITQYQQLAGDDPYLQYITATYKWEQLKQQAHDQKIAADAATTLARALLDEVARLTQAAIASKQPQIAGGLMQLQARICASPLVAEPGRAMNLLDEAGKLLGQSQLPLKALFLIQSNQPDPIWELLEQAGDDVSLPGETWSLIVDAFADLALRRPQDALLGERAAQLAIKAWNASPSTQERIRIAQALIRLHSWDVCLTLLGSDPLPTAAPQLNLAIGQSLLGMGRDVDQAVKVLTQVALDLPESSQAHLWLAMAYARSQRHAQACEHYRQVRTLEKPATVTWWQATLGLSQSLAAMGQTQAATQILQVTLTLYPVIGDDALAKDLVALLGRLQKS